MDGIILNEWLIFSSALFGIWLVVYMARPLLRRKMIWASLLTAPFGLTEPLFVPSYWNPPSLFNLAATTGFDVESLVFCFAIGGLGSVLYNAILGVRPKKMSKKEMMSGRHRFHRLAVVSPVLVFVPLIVFTSINAIYSASLAMLVGGLATMWCRPDLQKNVLVGGALFMALYFIFFLFINLAYPNFISVWNLSALSGIMLAGVPLEELLFASTFGMMWSSIYEHMTWQA